MGEAEDHIAAAVPEPALEARRLVRAAGSATLATQADGQPFVSLVTPAAAPDLSPLLWLSTLSEHTRQLRAEPRCALLFTGAPTGPNPQTTPRVTLTGQAAPVDGPEAAALKARWLARHPYAALYADFADFALWRVVLGGAMMVGGFATAVRLRLAELLPEPAAVAAVAAAEAGIIEHVNADYADAVSAIAEGLLGQAPAGIGETWHLAAVDVDGADLAVGERVCRLHFLRPVASAEAIRAELVRAARGGRQGDSANHIVTTPRSKKRGQG
jgi:heme iron utilization protein